MKLQKIINANEAIIEITKMRFPPVVARNLMKLKKKIQDELEFSAEEEMKILDKYAKKDEDGNIIINSDNMYLFDNVEICNICKAQMKTLFETEIEDMPIVTIKDSDIIDGEIKPETMYLLYDFIDFVEG